MIVTHIKTLATINVVLLLSLFSSDVSAQSSSGGVIYEDFKGLTRIPTGDGIDTGYRNRPYFVNPSLSGLMALESVSNAVVRNGRLNGLDWGQSNPQLCDFDNAGTMQPTAEACRRGIMGRIFYTVIKAPAAGNITLYVANDDDVRIDLSDNINLGNNYRAAVWNIPVGVVGSYTNSQNTYVRVGSFNAPEAGSCLLMRGVWANHGGRNYMRLSYTTPGSTTRQSFSSSSLISPTDSDRILEKCPTVALAMPTLQLNKKFPDGRNQASDQFILSANLDGNNLVSQTTSGAANDFSLSEVAIPVSGSNTTVSGLVIKEEAASGTSFDNYGPPQASCEIISSPTSSRVGELSFIGSSNNAWTLPEIRLAENVRCTITNTPARASLSLSKTSSVATATRLRTGEPVVYTLEARNPGPNHANGAVLRDPAVVGVSCTTLTCAATGGALCPQTSDVTVAALQGNGITIPTFPVNGNIRLTLTCAVTASGY